MTKRAYRYFITKYGIYDLIKRSYTYKGVIYPEWKVRPRTSITRYTRTVNPIWVNPMPLDKVQMEGRTHRKGNPATVHVLGTDSSMAAIIISTLQNKQLTLPNIYTHLDIIPNNEIDRLKRIGLQMQKNVPLIDPIKEYFDVDKAMTDMIGIRKEALGGEYGVNYAENRNAQATMDAIRRGWMKGQGIQEDPIKDAMDKHVGKGLSPLQLGAAIDKELTGEPIDVNEQIIKYAKEDKTDINSLISLKISRI